MASVPCLEDPTSLDDMLLARLGMVVGTAGALVRRVCEDQFGISRREWEVLAWAAHRDGITSSEVAALTHTGRARTSRAVSSLVAKKLVARQVVGHRRVLVLTEAGRAMYRDILPQARAIHHELLSALPNAGNVQCLAEMIGALQTEADRMAARRRV